MTKDNMLKQILFMSSVFCTTITAMKDFIPRIVYHKNSVHYSLVEQLSKKFNMMSIHPKEEKLDNSCTTIHATHCIIPPDNQKRKSHYIICLSEGNSFIGQSESNTINMYAPIPMAAAYALERELIKRILIIDENITPNTIDYYSKHGNGSILFPKNNPELEALFTNKIITHNQITEELWNFLHNQKNKIDLAFYNINIDDVERIEGLDPADAKERKSNIISLLYNFIPTIFIFSGDKEKYQTSLCSYIDYINKQAQKSVAFKNEPFPSSLPMPHLQGTMKSPSQSLSSSFSDLEQERTRLKKRLDMYTSPSDSEPNEEEFFDETSGDLSDEQ